MAMKAGDTSGARTAIPSCGRISKVIDGDAMEMHVLGQASDHEFTGSLTTTGDYEVKMQRDESGLGSQTDLGLEALAGTPRRFSFPRQTGITLKGQHVNRTH